jgi:hypothetical protein
MVISRIDYSHGMLKNPRDRRRDRVIAFVGNEIPLELAQAVEENDILGESGSYGDPDVGSPIEYDHLVIAHDRGKTEIEFFNKGISIALGDDERERRIFRVCVVLYRLAVRGK